MSDLRNEAVRRAVLLLNAGKAQYKIIAEDGTEYGELKLAPPEPPEKTMKRNRVFRNGELKTHYSPYLEKLNPGDLAQIPVGDFPPESLRSAITAAACNRWGKGAAMSCIRDGSVELLRLQ